MSRSFRSGNARRWFLAAVMLLCVPPLASQDPWITGKVRLRAPSIAKSRIFGTVDRAAPDTLILRSFTRAGTDTVLAIPVAAITRLQVSTGKHGNALKGLGLGLLAGGVGGAVFGAVVCKGPGEWDSDGCAKILGILGAGAGAIVGLVVGAFSRSDTWVDVPLAGPRVTLDWRGEGGSLHLGARFAF